MPAAALIDPLSLGSAGTAPLDAEYRIGTTDQLKIIVFQVPDLSLEQVRVGSSGLIEVPLIGSLRAAGRTPEELAGEIASQLSERYLQDPQVTVTVTEAASEKITVDGAVNQPGVYEMRGRTTLLQAVAMAQGPSRLANLESVAVFRTIEGRRMVALFDLGAIRNGQAEDPLMRGDDVIVVDTSRLSAAMRGILETLPGFAVFRFF
jgi:polysaccharide export outer membrane protein